LEDDHQSELNQLSAKQLKQRSKLIDKGLNGERRKKKKEISLLLLGPGQSGKSTFGKQMKILACFGFTERERENFRWIVHTNTINAICDLIVATKRLKVRPENENYQLAKEIYIRFRGKNPEQAQIITVDTMSIAVYPLDKELAKSISRVWRDPNVQQMFLERRSEFLVSDSTSYYLENVERIGEESYVPNDEDILRARLITTAVVETHFEMVGHRFCIVDVGGQKGLRRKWLPLFSNVTAVIFFVAMSEYDLMMEEDPSTNRMRDSLELWESVANQKDLQEVPIILFFNKKDLFKEKIKRVDLSVCFRSYKGGKNYKAAAEFLTKKFMRVVKKGRKGSIVVHRTIATDTANIRLVWETISQIFLTQAFERLGV